MFSHLEMNRYIELDSCKSLIFFCSECSFLTKTINIERLGGRAVIVTESDPSEEQANVGEGDVYIEMVDDNSGRETTIPAGFLLGKNGRIIKSTLRRLKRNYAIINIPVNLTFTPVEMINHPPWS